jgi:hypothetical protein
VGFPAWSEYRVRACDIQDLNQARILDPQRLHNAAFVTASGGTAADAESALLAALFSGDAYANIHDATFPGGEIRGRLVETPEPATGGLMLVAFGVMMRKRYTRWRRRANQAN